MSYIDGFVVAVPTAYKEKYIAFAKSFGSYCDVDMTSSMLN